MRRAFQKISPRESHTLQTCKLKRGRCQIKSELIQLIKPWSVPYYFGPLFTRRHMISVSGL